MFNITPNELFDHLTPDTVAETVSGVPDELYSKLWSLVPLYDDHPFRETPDCFDNNLSSMWHHLSTTEQYLLNELAESAL